MCILRALAAICVIFTFLGCLRTRSDIEGSQLKTQVATLQKSRAENSARSEEFDERFRELNGLVNEALETLSEAEKLRKSQKENHEKEKEERAGELKAYSEELDRLAEEVKDLKVEMAILKKASKPKSTSKKGPWSQAEEHFRKRAWKQAVASYDDYREANPKGRLYSTATYKMGVAFQKLKMNDEAKVFFEEVIEKDPTGASAKKAKYRLSLMTKKKRSRGRSKKKKEAAKK